MHTAGMRLWPTLVLGLKACHPPATPDPKPWAGFAQLRGHNLQETFPDYGSHAACAPWTRQTHARARSPRVQAECPISPWEPNARPGWLPGPQVPKLVPWARGAAAEPAARDTLV